MEIELASLSVMELELEKDVRLVFFTRKFIAMVSSQAFEERLDNGLCWKRRFFQFTSKCLLYFILFTCSKKGDGNSLICLEKKSVEVDFNERCSAKFAISEVFGC